MNAVWVIHCFHIEKHKPGTGGTRMPIDKKRDMWKPGMPWEQAVDDMKYVRGLAAELGRPGACQTSA